MTTVNIHKFMSALKRAAVFGWFILFDGFNFDDVRKIISNIPELMEIAEEASFAKPALEELKSLTFRDFIVLGRETFSFIEEVIDAVERIQATGDYKQTRAIRSAPVSK